MTYSMDRLNQALSERFTDASEIKDVACHGCAAGVSGFIYSSELADFFNEHEEAIEDVLHELGLQPTDLVTDPESWTFQDFKEKAVWTVVEDWCQAKA